MADVHVVPVPVAVPQLPLPMVVGQVPAVEMAAVPVE